MGDPHGIGPEVLLRALQDCPSKDSIRPLIFGDPDYLASLKRELKLSLDLDRIDIISTGKFAYPPRWGTVARSAGKFTIQSLQAAVEHCRNHHLPLLVTPPINKRSARRAGFQSPGQTEFIASFFSTSEPAMAFFSDSLHVLLTTVHLPLRRVAAVLKQEHLVQKTLLFYEALRSLGISKPRVAVCGLNPHASEEGLFGDEEQRILSPALKTLARRLGRERVFGPFPADTLFQRALRKEFDGVVALYHDQGLIPVKLVAFDSAVNVTLGLPLVRTSPDHGTAFDIAGRGIANPSSMIAAIEWGLRLAKGRKK